MRGYCLRDASSRKRSGFVLPNAKHDPPEPSEGCIRLRVAPAVRRDLVAPPSRVGFRLNAVLRTAVPEAAIDEDGDLGGGKDNVGAPPRQSRNCLIDAEAQPATVKLGAESEFGCGIAP